MKYKRKPLAAKGGASFPSWLPSTWPKAPANFNAGFVDVLRQIFEESILGEIGNVIGDIMKSNGGLHFRGHVVAISLMCALDAVSSYGYRGEHMRKFVENHFPAPYRPHGGKIYGLYRNSFIHSWNLFEATIWAGNEPIQKTGGTLSFGLLNFFDALQAAVNDFLAKLPADKGLQGNSLRRYTALQRLGKP